MDVLDSHFAWGFDMVNIHDWGTALLDWGCRVDTDWDIVLGYRNKGIASDSAGTGDTVEGAAMERSGRIEAWVPEVELGIAGLPSLPERLEVLEAIQNDASQVGVEG